MHAHDRTLIANLGFADRDKGNSDHEKASQFLVQPQIAGKLAGLNTIDRGPRGTTIETTVIHDCEVERARHAQHLVELKTSYDQEVKRYEKAFKSRVDDDFSDFSHLRSPEDALRCYQGNVKNHGTYTPSQVLAKQSCLFSFTHSVLIEAKTEVPIHKGENQYRTTIGFIDVALRFNDSFALSQCGQIQCTCGLCNWRLSEWPVEKKETLVCRGWDAFIEVKIDRLPVSDVIRQISLYRTYAGDHNTQWVLATPWPINEREKVALDARLIHHILLGRRFEAFKQEESPDAQSTLEL